jgi:hypothetical protein
MPTGQGNNEKGPDMQVEAFRQMLTQHMVIKRNLLKKSSFNQFVISVDGNERTSWASKKKKRFFIK